MDLPDCVIDYLASGLLGYAQTVWPTQMGESEAGLLVEVEILPSHCPVGQFDGLDA